MEKEENLKNNLDNKTEYRKTAGDLKFLLKEFAQNQKHYLNIEKEEEEKQTLDNIFNYPARELEKRGVCIRKLDLIESVYESYGQYLIHFQKRTTKDFKNKITRYKFGNGDIVGLFEFSEKVHADPLYKGVIYEFNEKKIVVAFDEDIEADKLPKNICLVQLCNQITYDRIKETLDKLENFEIKENNLNVVQVLFGIRDPSFKIDDSDHDIIEDDYQYSQEYLEKLKFYNSNLNDSQKAAVKFCLDANELALIHGPPGTGKTTTVVELILQSIVKGCKILVVAPSNIAVDNIAEKLIQFRSLINFEVCRIGHPARIMESIVDISLDAIVEKSPNVKFVKDVKREIKKVEKELSRVDWRDKEKKNNLKKQLFTLRDDIKGSYRNTVVDIHSKSKVTLATCVGAADFFLNESLRKSSQGVFDLVVIDECAQSTEATCWISILNTKKIVLAGDHLQLAPTIKSNQAMKELGFTLFDRMVKLYGRKVSKLLNTQYRMNKAIMEFSSNELYERKLIADKSVENHKLTDLIIDKEKLEDTDELHIINENLILLDTHGFQLYECVDADSGSKYNIGEAKISKFLVDYLIKNTIANSCLGIITPYSAQVNLLREYISFDEYKELEISTVDGFQGREKEVIILSLVRSNRKSEVGFLADNRRLNVAITRAKRMVILICDVSTVSNDDFLKKMVDFFSKKAKQINIIGNIFDYKEIENIQFESDSANKGNVKSSTTSDMKNKSENTVMHSEDKKKKKKKRGKDNKTKDELKNIEGDNNIENNINLSQIIDSNTDIISKKLEADTLKHNEVSKDFINKIQAMINNFINSKEKEFKIEGLSSAERKYIHYFADIKNLSHESKGDSENRVLILNKKTQITSSKEKIDDQINKIDSVTKPLNDANIKNKIETSNKPKIETKNFNPKAKLTEDWDEIDDILNEIQNKQKDKCNFSYCEINGSKFLSLCNYCNSYFCNNHLRCIIHDCILFQKNESNTNAYVKAKVNQKIDELEKKRNKKPKSKKK